MGEQYLTNIPVGREGYVYLIHAEVTNRYKIGRTTNPVVRHQILQNQSPYPLRILDCFWSIDATAEELSLHKQFTEFRVYGEWFELGDFQSSDSIAWFILSRFQFSMFVTELGTKAAQYLYKSLNLELDKYFAWLEEQISTLYEMSTSYSEYRDVEAFVNDVALFLSKKNVVACCPQELLQAWIDGAIHGFTTAYNYKSRC